MCSKLQRQRANVRRFKRTRTACQHGGNGLVIHFLCIASSSRAAPCSVRSFASQNNPYTPFHNPQGRPNAKSVVPAAMATYCLPSIA